MYIRQASNNLETRYTGLAKGPSKMLRRSRVFGHVRESCRGISVFEKFCVQLGMTIFEYYWLLLVVYVVGLVGHKVIIGHKCNTIDQECNNW